MKLKCILVIQSGFLLKSSLSSPAINEDRVGFLYVVRSLTDIKKHRQWVLSGIAIVFLGAMGLAATIAILFGRQLNRPLSELSNAVSLVTRNTDYSVRIGHSYQDEFGVLARGFNEMLSKIEAHQSELKKAYQELRKELAERKKAEEERALMENQLHHSQRLETIGTLAGGIAHDFNNILQAITGAVEIVLIEQSPDSEIRQNLDPVMVAIDRAKYLVRQLLVFSRQHVDDRQLSELPAILEEAVQLLRFTIPPNIEIEIEIDKECGYSWVDSAQIHQVLMNLGTNAYQAIGRETGRIKFTLKEIALDGSLMKTFPALNSPRLAEISVSDNGEGIKANDLHRLFEPFFTTKEVGKGTGLGLSVVHGIVTAHNGVITADSEPGKGATFRIYLPVSDEIPDSVEVRFSQTLSGKERILFVDDDEMILMVHKDLLERRGYEVSICTESADALQTFEDFPNKFDLVITDQIMPNMTGIELAENLLSLRPDMPIILISGYSDRALQTTAKEAGIRGFVMKPVLADELCASIREIMDHVSA